MLARGCADHAGKGLEREGNRRTSQGRECWLFTYGRKLGRVLLAGLDCNLEQVKRGLARLGLGVPKQSKQS